MRFFVVNTLAVIVSVVLFIAYEFGAVGASDAFFLAAGLIASYTGFQLIQREGKPVIATLKDIVSRPGAHPRFSAYVAYVTVLSLSSVIVAQTVIV